MGSPENHPHGTLGPEPPTGHDGNAKPDLLPEDASFLAFLDRHWPRAQPATRLTVTLTGGLQDASVPNTDEVDAIGRFKIRRQLGRGGFATVYLAYDPLRDGDVALKIPYPHLRHSVDLRQRFQREARATASLEHPQINCIYETGQSTADIYISSHFCPGPTLAEWLKHRVVPVSPDSAARLIKLLSGAVQHAHDRGILHRDLKPSNILLERLDKPLDPGVEESMFEGFFPRLCDFGLAKILDAGPDDAPTRTGILLGTPRYMAPEQAAGQSFKLGPRTDIYALGVILYELLVGRPPFVADSDLETMRQVRSEEPLSIRRLQPKVPRDLDTICMKCLEKEPERRYASAGDLAADLGRFIKHSSIQARPVSHARRIRLWTGRHPVQALALLVGLLIVVVLPVSLGWHTARLERAFRVAQEERVLAEEFEAQARTSEKAARSNEAAVNQHMYSSDMRLAHQLLKEGEFAAVSALVDRYLPDHEGQPDRRGFAWWYLRRFRDVEQRTWQAHAGGLNMLAFSADGRTLLTASYADHSAKTWDVAAGKLLATFPTRKWDESRDREAGAISPDGQTVVTLVAEDTADVWDARTGTKKARLKRGGKIFCTTFSPDGRYLLLGSELGTAIWRCESWNTPHHLFAGTRLAVFSPDGKSLATVWNPTYSTRIQIFDTDRFTVKQTLEFWFPVLDIAYSPDGRTMAAVADGAPGTVISLYNPQTGQWIENVKWHEENLRRVSYSADGRFLASVTRDGILRFWDLETYQVRGAFRGATNRITQFQFSPGERSLATATDRGSVCFWNAALLAGPEPINGRTRACDGHLVFNPQRNQIAVANRDRSVSLVDAGAGRVDFQLIGNLDHVKDIAFSPDGRHVTTVDTRQLRVWDATNGRPVWQAEGPGQSTIAWSPLGHLIATGGSDHHIRFFDSETGKEVALLKGHTGEVLMVRFFPDGKRLASAGFDCTVRIWDVETRREVGSAIPHEVPVFSLAISHDGRELAAGLPLGKLALWKLDGSKGPERRDIPWSARYSPWSAGQPLQIAYSPDGSMLGTAGPGGLFRAQHRATGELAFALNGGSVDPASAAWSPDGSILASVSSSNEAMLWNTSSWRGQRVFGGPLSVVCSLAFSSDSKTLVVATDRSAGLDSLRINEPCLGPNLRIPVTPSRLTTTQPAAPVATRDFVPWQSTTDTLRFWDTISGAEQCPLDPLPTLTALPDAAWSRHRNLLAAANKGGSVWVWDMKHRKLLANLFLNERIRNTIDAARFNTPPLVAKEVLPGDATAPLLAFSPDGDRFAAFDGAGRIRFWDTNSWQELPPLAGAHAETKVLAYAPDGKTLAVNQRGRLTLYDPLTGQIRTELGAETAPAIACGRFSPDGRALAIGAIDGHVQFIDMASRSLESTLVGHADAVVSMDFTPDGRTLATGSWDATVRLWDVASKREIAVLDGHRGRVQTVAFSPDGTLLASGGEIDDSSEQGLGELFLWRTAFQGKARDRRMQGE
jgi:eukaryotic-like serine/threonine-protein kinase